MESKITSIAIRLMVFFVAATLCFSSCKEEPKTTAPTTQIAPVKIPRFNQDSAYAFIEKQLSFGYRVPGTPESKACKDWMVTKLKSYGASVTEQNFKADFLTVKGVDATNIIASFNPNKKTRVLLCAHYDSRLVAEKDKDDSKKNQPIPGADDGASGTAALLEIARVLNENPIDLGVDIVLFDAEDQGDNDGASTTWCLGSQYWTKNPHQRKYTANFGILLDMIAAEGAVFHKEGHSMTYAAEYTNKIWKLAQGMGYGDLFQNQRVGGITDDHYYINTILGIPTVDIINTSGGSGVTFGAYHHTHNDNIDIINKRTLRIVGQVVTATVYKTYDRSFQKI
jgi:hypothetical protein